MQFILDARLLDEADLPPAARIGEQHIGGVGVIELPGNRILAAARHGEGQPVLRARTVRTGAGVGFIVNVVAIERRIAVIDQEAEIVRYHEIEIGADCENLRFAALSVGPKDRDNTGKAGGIGKRPGAGCACKLGAAPRGNRGFGPAEDATVLGVGVERINIERDPVAGFELQRTRDGQALEIAADRALTRVVRRIDQPLRGARGLELVGLQLAADELGRVRLQRCPQRPADCAILVLIDVGGKEAVAVGRKIGVERALIIARISRRNADLAILVIKRAHRAQIDRPGNPDRGQLGIAGLVDDRRADQFGRELVELDPAIIARRDHFAAIEQRKAEIRPKPADRDLLRPATHALSGHTRQTGERIGDRKIGQQAEVFGGNHLDNARGIALGVERILDRAANAGDGDVATRFIDLHCLGIRRGLRRRRHRACHQHKPGRRTAQQTRIGGKCLQTHHIPPPGPP